MINLETTGILMQGDFWLEYTTNSRTAHQDGRFYNEDDSGILSAVFIDIMEMKITSNIPSVQVKTSLVDGWLNVYSSPPSVWDSANYTITSSYDFDAYFKAGNNGGTTSRLTKIEISGSGFYAELYISQMGSDPILRIVEDVLIFKYNDNALGNRLPIKIESNIAWTLSRVEGTWFSFYRNATGGSPLSTISDEGTKTLYVLPTNHYNSVDFREGSFKVQNNGLSDECEIIQTAEHYLNIIPSIREYPHTGGYYSIDIAGSIPNDTITIHNNTLNMVLSIPTGGISIQLSPTGTYNLGFYVEPNVASEWKIRHILFENNWFKVSNNTHKRHTLTQIGRPSSDYLSIDKNDLVFGSKEQSDVVTISTNLNVNTSTITVGDGSWISTSLTGNKLKIFVTENISTTNFRSNTVTIGFGVLSRTITIYQMYRVYGGGGGGSSEHDFDFSVCDCYDHQHGSPDYYNCLKRCYKDNLNFQTE